MEGMSAQTGPAGQQQSFYEAVGGHETFRTIVRRFYEQVREDEILRPLYPDDDLDGAEERLRIQGAMTRWFVALAEQRPLAVV